MGLTIPVESLLTGQVPRPVQSFESSREISSLQLLQPFVNGILAFLPLNLPVSLDRTGGM